MQGAKLEAWANTEDGSPEYSTKHWVVVSREARHEVFLSATDSQANLAKAVFELFTGEGVEVELDRFWGWERGLQFPACSSENIGSSNHPGRAVHWACLV